MQQSFEIIFVVKVIAGERVMRYRAFALPNGD